MRDLSIFLRVYYYECSKYLILHKNKESVQFFLNPISKAVNCTNLYNVCNFEKHTTVSMYNGRYAHTYT